MYAGGMTTPGQDGFRARVLPWVMAAVIAGMKTGKPADGYIQAIEICGKALAMHFPPTGSPRNAFPNSVLET